MTTPDQPPTCDQALAHAARLLTEAELETGNLARMERLEHLAETWVNIAGLQRDRERV